MGETEILSSKKGNGVKFRSGLILMVVIAASAATGMAFLGGTEDRALAEFSVANMTCGSCVRNIETALAGVSGVDEVEVSVATGRSRVSFDPNRIGAEKIAEKITAAGYPAQVGYVLSTEEYRAAREEESRLADKFVARIGERLIPREDFQAAAEVQRSRSGAPARDQDVLRATWQALVQREILLTAAEKNGIVVQNGEVQAEIEKMRGGMKGFDQLIAKRYGSVNAFAEKLKTDLTTRRLIEESVLSGKEAPDERNRKVQAWYAQLAAGTEIRILDQQLKAAMASSGGGCGGSCC